MSTTSSTPTPRLCPGCDEPLKHRSLVVCHPCWSSLPGPLSSKFNRAPDYGARVEATREIYEHFRQKKLQPELF